MTKKPIFNISLTVAVGEEADSIEAHKKALEEATKDVFSIYGFGISNIKIEHVGETNE